jgi:hypothetical protein
MKYLSWGTSGVVLIVAAAAFILAFHNIRALAIANGVPEDLAWLVPIMVDGVMMALAFTRLEAVVNRQKTGWLVILIGAAALLSVALNWAHAGRQTWAIVIAVIQPILLLTAFETLMYQLGHRIAKSQQATDNPWRARARWLIDYARGQQTAVTDLQGQINGLQTAVTDLQAQNTKLFEANKQIQTLNKRWQAIGKEAQPIVMLNAGEITEQQAVDMSGLDVRTVRTWAGRINGVSK